ncbi:zinc finger and SCAN domain-containing protein 4 [Puma concolor]|uniref:Zinc finger and SCAN domain-containing protein 4 n=1 Tax=Puma concolor TaxID=9696 RepID=A0A6P6H3Y6_PUMCO|nr:zinc finger and SCAN domain-containing protein 4 [Puma concolor]
MALDLRISCQGEPSRNVPGSENLEHKPSQGPAIQGEEIYEFPSTQLSLFQNSNNSCAREELQNLYNLFHSWLQPEKHSKDEIISRLVLEQFMINGHCSDRSMLKEKWNTSGRNMEKFMENLTDDGMKPPGLVHVHMQGQEALFSENMPLREVIVHFTKQLSAGTPTGENMGTPSCTPQDTSLAMGRGDENKENGGNIDQVNDGITSQGNEIPSLLIIQEEGCPRCGILSWSIWNYLVGTSEVICLIELYCPPKEGTCGPLKVKGVDRGQGSKGKASHDLWELPFVS